MAKPPNSEDRLMERLMALGGNKTKAAPPTLLPGKPGRIPLSDAKPHTKEDALADRLKNLRNQTEQHDVGPKGDTPRKSDRDSRESTPASVPEPQVPLGGRPSPGPSHPDRPACSGDDSNEAAKDKLKELEEEPDDDPMLQTDDKMLEELLADVDPEEGEWQTNPKSELERIRAEMDRLAKEGSREENDENAEEKKVDDEAEEVLAKALAEAQLDDILPKPSPPSSPTQRRSPSLSPSLALPSTPSALPAPPSDTPAADDPVLARLSALQTTPSSDPVSSPASSSSALGLPSVPTSQPAAQPRRLTTRTGYTDEDAATWCIVCLEDATLRCLGCDEDDDMYCSRCWREMHVGPMAGYEERSHRAEFFVKPGKKEKGRAKKVLLGA